MVYGVCVVSVSYSRVMLPTILRVYFSVGGLCMMMYFGVFVTLWRLCYGVVVLWVGESRLCVLLVVDSVCFVGGCG